jgi:hypothetical protein
MTPNLTNATNLLVTLVPNPSIESVMDWKWILDIALVIVGFFGAWTINRLYAEIDSLKAKNEKFQDDLTNLKTSLPQNYVHKNDLSSIEKRFDKLEDLIRELSDKLDKKADK